MRYVSEPSMKDVASCDTDEDLVSEYAYILRDYLQEQNEANLNRLSEFVRKLVARGITPEAILAVHFEIVRDMMKKLALWIRFSDVFLRY